jgi:hypothetical protein
MAIRYYPGSSGISFDQECAQGQPTVANPLQGLDDAHVVITQLYMQRASCYRRPEENARCPLEVHPALAYFCEDSERVPTGVADLVTWTRTWANVPANYSFPRSASVTFPGFTDVGLSGDIARDEFTAVTPAKLDVTYYLVGAGTGYSTQFNIPVLDAEIFTSRTDTSPLVSKPLFGGGVLLVNGYSGSASSWTTPSQKTYRDRITYDVSNGGYSSRAETSQLEHYLGNIWQRSALQLRTQ